jgi:uncharacterized BrkB/YihY/UPF0761 family membrane protein
LRGSGLRLAAVGSRRYRRRMSEHLEHAEKLAVEEVEKELHLRHHLSSRRERAMFATLGFFVALALTRGITTWLHYHGAGANGGIIIDGVHIHHEAFGIIGLILLSYGWLLLYGLEPEPNRRWFRLTGLAYGICTALILDEFALWLNLKDVYWQRQGRESVEALAAFAGFLLWAVLIWPFALAVWRHLRTRTPEQTT